MWDPRNYEDTDYGLGNEESFEPVDDEEWTVDPETEPHVMTVLGPISPDELGATMADEHLLSTAAPMPAETLDDPVLAMQELTNLVTAGGRAIVESTLPAHGRDPLGLFEIARRVPAHIVMATGERATRVAEELANGIGPQKLRPGVVLVDGATDDVDAVLGLAVGSGHPVIVDAGLLGRSLPGRSIVAFRDSVPSADEAAAILADGHWLLLSGLGHPRVGHDQRVARLIVDTVERGNAGNILLGHDFDRRSMWQAANGRPGLTYILERFVLDLMEAGASGNLVRQLLVENPAAALALPPRAVQPSSPDSLLDT